MMSSVDPLRIMIILLHNTTDKSRVSPDKEQSKDKLMTNVFTELLISSPKRGSLNHNKKRSIYSRYPVRYRGTLLLTFLFFAKF